MSEVGRLLVATPLIADPTFERTVVLLLAHGDEGAFGVVLNRPSSTPVEEVSEAWAPACAAPAVVFVGGPVAGDGVLGLGRPGRGGAEEELVGGCVAIDLHGAPGPDPAAWHGVRLFAGSAGWAPGQLEDELAEGAWWILDAARSDLLDSDPCGLWTRVLRRQRGEVAWFAHHPADPSDN